MNRPETTQRVIDAFTKILDAQDKKGVKKYGETIDNAKGYDWNLMALEESADLMKYLIKENNRLRLIIQAQDLCLESILKLMFEEKENVRA